MKNSDITLTCHDLEVKLKPIIKGGIMEEKYLVKLKEIFRFIDKHYEDDNPVIITIWKFTKDLIEAIENEKV